jgi:UDP-N-acetyl-D-glucosamine dehydrogenase
LSKGTESTLKVSIIGQGYVGQSLSMAAASVGHNVVGFDLDTNLINRLGSGLSHVPGVESKLLLNLIETARYQPTSNAELIKGSQIIIIAVPTPVDDERRPDLAALHSACELIGKTVSEPTLVISESTSYPGTLRNLIKPIIENLSKTTFLYAVAPERVDPGNSQWNILNTPRVVAGLTNEATEMAIKFYKSFCNEIYRASTPEVAEAAKLLENTFRQVNIALVNEFSSIMNRIGISSFEVVNAAATKPFGFMKFFPSIGVGGHCIPVDPEYFSYFAESLGTKSRLTNLVNELNINRPSEVAFRIMDLLGNNFKGSQIQVAGIAYKGGVSDIRESPSLELIHKLRKLGASVKWHDPIVQEWGKEISSSLDPKIDLGLIVTPHSKIDFSIWKEGNVKVLDLSANSLNYGWPKFL